MIQILLHGLKMDPLVSLHYYAPVCALINIACLPFTEGLAPFYELARIGPLVLVSNASVAFLLNVAAVFLVGAGSGLVLTLAGVFKVSGLSGECDVGQVDYLCITGYPSHHRICCHFRFSDHTAPNIW